MKKDKKGPFAPISLTGNQARWFVNYLENKSTSKQGEKARAKILEEVAEIRDENIICLN